MSKRLLPMVLVVGLVLAACGGDDPVMTKSSASTTSIIVGATTLPPNTTTRAGPSSSSEAPATSVRPPIRGDDDGGVIVFSSHRDGNEEIYVMNADGSGQQRLTNNPAYDHLPNWAPDGERIVFTADHGVNAETYVMDADGGNPRSLGGGGWSIWSTDGSQIAFMVSDGDSEIFVMSAPQDDVSVGGDPRRLTSNDSHDWEPAWSPDGSQIAFVSDRDGNAEIYIMNSDGSDQRRLTDNQTDEWLPAWSPDGAQIAFMSDRNDPDPIGCRPTCNYDLFVLALGDSLQGPDSDWQQVTDHIASDLHPAWSPDGSRLAFVSDRDGDDEIYTLNVADALLTSRGSDIRQLTNNEFADSSPAWRPDTSG